VLVGIAGFLSSSAVLNSPSIFLVLVTSADFSAGFASVLAVAVAAGFASVFTVSLAGSSFLASAGFVAAVESDFGLGLVVDDFLAVPVPLDLLEDFAEEPDFGLIVVTFGLGPGVLDLDARGLSTGGGGGGGGAGGGASCFRLNGFNRFRIPPLPSDCACNGTALKTKLRAANAKVRRPAKWERSCAANLIIWGILAAK
jgi:hypothetical protein